MFGDGFALIHLPGESAGQVQGDGAILGKHALLAVDFQGHVPARQVPEGDGAAPVGAVLPPGPG